MRRNTTALRSIPGILHRRTSASAHHHSQRSDYGKAPHVVQREDDQVCRDREARVKVHFNVATPSMYQMLTGQENYNSTVSTKLDIVLTGQEQYESYISTVGSNLVHVESHQHQPLLRLFLSTNGGVTTRTAAVVRRQEGKKPEDKRHGIRSTRRTAPSDQGRFSTITRQELLYKELALTDDLVHNGDSTRPSSRYGGECFHPGSFTTLACTVWTDPRRLKSRPEGEKTVVSPNTFSVKYSSYRQYNTIITGWRTTIVNDDFYFDDTPLGYES